MERDVEMKKIIALITALSLIFSLAGCTKGGSKEIVAKVNDRVITLNEYNKTLAMYKKSYEGMYGPDIWTKEAVKGKTFIEIVKEQVLNKMIDDEIIYQAAEKDNIKADDAAVEKQFKENKDQIDKNQEFKQFLKDNNIDDAFIKEQIKKDLAVTKFRENYIKSLGINDEKIKAYYEQNKENYKKDEVKASHILIKTVDNPNTMNPLPEDQVKQAQAKAKDILVRVKNGEDFAKLAKEFSDDPGSAANGGDLGVFGRGVMVKEFEDVAFSLKKGEISDLVKTPFGYHIIKVVDKVNEVQKLEEVKDSIKADLENKEYKDKIEELKKAAKIEKKLDNIKEK